MSLSLLQIAAEAVPVASGDLAESTTALARALAEQGTRTTLLSVLPADAEPPPGFARRLARLAAATESIEIFEGIAARGVPCWLLRAPPGRSARDVLAASTADALVELDLDAAVVHAHGAEAVASLHGIGRVRPSAVRVATVTDPAGVDAWADAVVVPGPEAASGALAIPPGLDDAAWDPRTDATLVARYSAAEPQGKRACRRAVQRARGLAPRDDVPLFAVASAPLLARFTSAIAAGRPLHVQVAAATDGVSLRLLLGAADFYVADEDEALGVLRALRYGAVPLAPEGSAAGARLVEYDEPSRTGLGFLVTPETLSDCAFRAARLFADGDAMAGLRARALSTDVSWRAPARRYLDLFDRLSRE
jgi:hypothetical protein